VVVDLLAPTTTLGDLKLNMFPTTSFTGLSVGLRDLRVPSERTWDDNAGISYISGDIRKQGTWKEIEQRVGNGNVDLLMERGCGGLYWMPTRALFYQATMQRV
jgi:hypothetical protein